MNKILLFVISLSFCFIITAQPPPPNSGTEAPRNPNNDKKPVPSLGGDQTDLQSLIKESKKDKYCNIYFYYNGKQIYSEYLDDLDNIGYRGTIPKIYDNKIDEIAWEGTRCYCWAVIYQNTYFQGLNMGLWADSDSGNYDLSYFLAYDFNEMRWERYDQIISSYSIYCY